MAEVALSKRLSELVNVSIAEAALKKKLEELELQIGTERGDINRNEKVISNSQEINAEKKRIVDYLQLERNEVRMILAWWDKNKRPKPGKTFKD